MKIAFEYLTIIFVQTLILNHLNVTDYLVPQIVVAIVFSLPVYWKLSSQILVGFLLGLFIDFFTATPGLQSSAFVFVPLLRSFILNFFDIDSLIIKKQRFHTSFVKFNQFLFVGGIVLFFYHFYVLSISSMMGFNYLSLWVTVFLSASTSLGLILFIQFVFRVDE